MQLRMLVMFMVSLLMGAGAAPAAAQAPDAQVKPMSTLLNLRDAPSPAGNIVAELAGGTPLALVGRTFDNNWLKVRLQDGREGWVASGYVIVAIDLNTVPILTSTPGVPAATPAPTHSIPAADAAVSADFGNGQVTAALLNLRSGPSISAGVLAELSAGTAVNIAGRSADNAWLLVQTSSGNQGWVYRAYIRTGADLAALPVRQDVSPAGAAVVPAGVLSNLTPTATSIFRSGQAQGNRANVFSKVGDSITVADDFLDPIGRGIYNLADYAGLQTTITYFSAQTARNQNSFANTSLAAGSGWTTATVLDPAFASPSECQQGEAPLVCEYRTTRPAVALIMLGSNDVRMLDAATYRANLERITRTTADMGIIPVLSTIPPYIGYEEQVGQFNAIIRETARSFGAPLWDYYGAMSALPNSGLSGDGLHPSRSPRGYEGAADFSGDNLGYGYVARNLTALQVLEALRTQVLTR